MGLNSTLLGGEPFVSSDTSPNSISFVSMVFSLQSLDWLGIPSRSAPRSVMANAKLNVLASPVNSQFETIGETSCRCGENREALTVQISHCVGSLQNGPENKKSAERHGLRKVSAIRIAGGTGSQSF